MSTTTRGKRRITFTLEAPEATAVFITGDFNGWDENAAPMKRTTDGLYQKILMLSPGRYEYKFKIDGRWLCDPGNPLQCDNRHGTMNSVVVVSETR